MPTYGAVRAVSAKDQNVVVAIGDAALLAPLRVYVGNMPRCTMKMHVAARVVGESDDKKQTAEKSSLTAKKSTPAEDLVVLDFSMLMVSGVRGRRGLEHNRHRYLHVSVGIRRDGKVAKPF